MNSNMKRRHHAWRNAGVSGTGSLIQHGATLVEVLVALLIVSLGLLGIAGLAASTFSYNKTSQLRLTGTALANDYADRARLNVFGFDRNAYNIAYGDNVTTSALNRDGLTVDQPDDATAADAVAAYDRNDFMNTVANRLPQGRAVVVSARGNARSMDIWLVWQEPQPTSADALALFQAGQRNCPTNLPNDVQGLASCMYFKVDL